MSTPFVKSFAHVNLCGYHLISPFFPGIEDADIWMEHVPKNEDCLYLNIWTPRFIKDQNTSQVPVMFFIHGGGFVAGTASLDIYDGRHLTKTEDVIVVSINYR